MAIPTAAKIRKYLGENYQKSDDEIIQLYVDTHRFYRKLKKEVDSGDLMMEHTNKGGATNVVKNPLAIELTKTVLVLNNLLKSLGLTPAQRKQLEGDPDDDDFDDF
ncbi:P27 family phage terminase small subunit [Lysinibacillus pakistanensis]|uniref:Phage terminase small subunit P27 family n=1 Tax=Lysinibacillus pakistanensis TaxID=759811 RepID=A0ABX6D9Y3_9BACI|nr:phage terminase small subunit P27 family [Lysinibacillus pakistanensis]